MTELLEKWARLEPERVELNLDGTFTLRRGASGFTRVVPVVLDRLPGYRDYVLGSVIHAIEARGWAWSLERTGHGHGSWMAGVGPEAAADWAGEDASIASPTAALLSAYLAALEAEKGGAE